MYVQNINIYRPCAPSLWRAIPSRACRCLRFERTEEKRRFDENSMKQQPKKKTTKRLPKTSGAKGSVRNDIGELAKVMHERFNQIDEKFEQTDKRFDLLQHQLQGQIESNALSFKEYTDSIATRLEKKIESLDRKVDGLDRKVDGLDRKLDKNTAGLVQLIETHVGEILELQGQVHNHEGRIAVLETQVL